MEKLEIKNNRREKSKIHNILYELLLKYNGQYRLNELDTLSAYERNSFDKHIEDAHEIIL